MQPIHAALPVAYFPDPTYWGVPTNIFGDLAVTPPEEETLVPEDSLFNPNVDNPFPDFVPDFGW